MTRKDIESIVNYYEKTYNIEYSDRYSKGEIITALEEEHKKDPRENIELMLRRWLENETGTFFDKSINVPNSDPFYNDIEHNIVKRVTKELGITQKELAEKLDVPQPTVTRWAKGEIPKMTKIALELMLENKELKEKFDILKKAHKILAE